MRVSSRLITTCSTVVFTEATAAISLICLPPADIHVGSREYLHLRQVTHGVQTNFKLLPHRGKCRVVRVGLLIPFPDASSSQLGRNNSAALEQVMLMVRYEWAVTLTRDIRNIYEGLDSQPSFAISIPITLVRVE
ncbi:hypothetical protein GGR57DRAFT_159752 [Xylariaceae sp. FL1272]|nr:hypothetical protein GGR57DRAFT_159752 [Xylariaceae sp. FL1272]